MVFSISTSALAWSILAFLALIAASSSGVSGLRSSFLAGAFILVGRPTASGFLPVWVAVAAIVAVWVAAAVAVAVLPLLASRCSCWRKKYGILPPSSISIVSLAF